MSALVEPWLADPDATVWHGDVREILPQFEAESVDCALTSPPFYGLRDYGADGQIGLEATPDEWAAELVAVFREVRRVLKPAGTLWIECGDSYAGAQIARDEGSPGRVNRTIVPGKPLAPGFKPKDLLGQPWLLAFALRADGWYLRQCIVWAKPNAMPESVRDRCTTSHSYVFLLSRSPRYFFDADAIAEPAAWERWGDQTTPKHNGTETASGWMQPKTKAELRAKANRGEMFESATKNARSVWTIPTQGYPGAHFATWPEKLVERILLAGCPEAVCSACGKARERLNDVTYERDDTGGGTTGFRRDLAEPDGRLTGTGLAGKPRMRRVAETVGWSDCGCGAGWTPGVCLDPFAGSGTTLQVARRLGRRSVGVELNAGYCRMIGERLKQLSLLA
jgi:DNA modification methylase